MYGPRVPAIVVSPYAKPQGVTDVVHDHTSVLRFLELWTGVREPNISAWRRKISGDLTGCFDFAHADRSIPHLPDTAALRRKADQLDSKLPKPAAPAPGLQVVPSQEPGTVPARPLPYQPWANASYGNGQVSLELGNAGTAAVQLQVYDRLTGLVAQRVDVAAGSHESASVVAVGAYDVAVHGPNGFLRAITGSSAATGVEVAANVVGSRSHPRLELRFENATRRAVSVTVTGLDRRPKQLRIAPGTQSVTADPIASAHGWYDISVELDGSIAAGYLRRFAGHLENGENSITG